MNHANFWGSIFENMPWTLYTSAITYNFSWWTVYLFHNSWRLEARMIFTFFNSLEARFNKAKRDSEYADSDFTWVKTSNPLSEFRKEGSAVLANSHGKSLKPVNTEYNQSTWTDIFSHSIKSTVPAKFNFQQSEHCTRLQGHPKQLCYKIICSDCWMTSSSEPYKQQSIFSLMSEWITQSWSWLE